MRVIISNEPPILYTIIYDIIYDLMDLSFRENDGANEDEMLTNKDQKTFTLILPR